MIPRLIFAKGIWRCYGGIAWGSGLTVAAAWASWQKDLSIGMYA